MIKSHISIRVSDLKKSVAFYSKLGFEVRREAKIEKFSTDLVFLALSPGFELELVYNWDNHSKPDHKDGYLHLGIEVDNLESFLRRLNDAGVQPLCPMNILPNGQKLCFVMDPDGYQVELVESPPK